MIQNLQHYRFFRKPVSTLVGGSGRSGTSLIMGCISHNFTNTGDQPAYRDDESNPKGFFEDVNVNFLNDRILETSGVQLLGDRRDGRKHRHGGWINKDKIETITATLPQIQEIKRLTKNIPFCLKDPRFSYTYPLWREFIPKESILLVIFRHPSKTASSMIKEPTPKKIKMSYEDALEVWHAAYSNILNFDNNDGQVVYIHYDQIFNREIDFLIKKINIKSINYGFIEPGLNRSQEKSVKDKYKKMYDLLMSKTLINL